MEDYNITSIEEENLIIEEENLYYLNSKIKNIKNSLELSVICNNKYNNKFEDFFICLTDIENNQFKNYIYFNNTVSS